MSGTPSQSVPANSIPPGLFPDFPLEQGAKPSRYTGPAIPVALFVMTGIFLDRWQGPRWEIWLFCGIVSAAIWFLFFLRKQDEYSLHALLGCCLFLGGAHHHFYWSISQANDISLFADETSQLVHLSGTIASPPVIASKKKGRFHSAFLRPDRTICRVRCTSIRDGDQSVSVSGLVRLNVTGHLLHAEPGDTIEVQGWLARPRKPMNPGDYDFTHYYRRQGIRAILYAEHPDAVKRIGSSRESSYGKIIGRLRNSADSQFSKYLQEENAQLASAILLGRRSGLDDDIRTAFATSGTMHFLAISGLHVGILAGLLWMFCRIVKASPITTVCVIVPILVGYALIVESRPPVIRATIMIVVILLGQPWHRQIFSGHLLALAALFVLALNPTDLFDIGAQLSFLSMAAIIWSGKVKFGSWSRSLAYDPSQYSIARQFLSVYGRKVLRGYFMVAMIWIFNFPLLASHFHIVSPVGLLLNVLLSPLLFLVLGAGHLFLFCCFLFPVAAPVVGAVFDFGLTSFVFIVTKASQVSLGHRFVAGPPSWWLTGFYIILACSVGIHFSQRYSHWRWRLLSLWVLLGLGVGLVPSKPNGLRCSFLSVGHGLAVLLEMPNGKTMLYDAGSLRNGQIASSTVQNALWHQHLSRIDTMVISHADFDHYNGVPEILKTIPVGSVIVSPPFLDPNQQKTAVEVSEIIADRKIPLLTVGKSNRIVLDPSVSIEVLHPAKDMDPSTDNASSIVLQIEYSGRRILITGDLEGEGLYQMLELPPRKSDIFLSPHHGSSTPNTWELAEWTRPDYVLVSADNQRRLEPLQDVYGPNAIILSTGIHGAIDFEIDAQGNLQCTHKW